MIPLMKISKSNIARHPPTPLSLHPYYYPVTVTNTMWSVGIQGCVMIPAISLLLGAVGRAVSILKPRQIRNWNGSSRD